MTCISIIHSPPHVEKGDVEKEEKKKNAAQLKLEQLEDRDDVTDDDGDQPAVVVFFFLFYTNGQAYNHLSQPASWLVGLLANVVIVVFAIHQNSLTDLKARHDCVM